MAIVSDETIRAFVSFVNGCNTGSLNDNEFSIIQAVFKHIGTGEFPSIEALAVEANVSKASISRFVQKCRLQNYQQFKTLMSHIANLLYLNLETTFLRRYTQRSSEPMCSAPVSSINRMYCTLS